MRSPNLSCCRSRCCAGLGHIPLANLGNLGGLLAGGMGGGMGGRGGPPAPNPEGLRPWDSLRALPQATQHGLEVRAHLRRWSG